MKKTSHAFIIFSLFFLISGSTDAQLAMADSTVGSDDVPRSSSSSEIDREPATVYLAPDEKTFVNKSLPIYLKFSTSEGGQNYDLKSLKNPEDTQPFYLDTEGLNYIRTKWAVDPETKEYVTPMREVEMELYADSKPPVVMPVLDASNRYTSTDGTIYYGEDLAASLKSSDGQSGVKGTYWSFDGSTWDSGKTMLNQKESGPYTLSYYGVDQVHNYTDVDQVSFVYDKTAPRTDLLRTEDGTFVFGPTTQVSFKIEEEHSGVDFTYFKMGDTGYSKIKTGDVLPRSLDDGSYTLSYYSVDKVANKEQVRTESIYLDKIAPETTISASPSYMKGDLMYISGKSAIELAATDNKAGVRETTYTSREESNATYSTPVNLANYHGYTSISYGSVDRVDNKEAVKKQKIFVDTLSPATTIKFIGDYYEVVSRFYVNADTKIELVSKDANSGVDYVEYGGIGNDFKKYDAPFSLTEEGYFGMLYRGVDRVENTEYSKSIDLYLDTKGPEVVYNFSNKPLTVEDGVPVYPVGTRLFLGATDDQSGTNTISYQVNDQSEVHYSSPKTIDISEKKAFLKGESYEIKIKSTDLVSNRSDEVIAFKIEK